MREAARLRDAVQLSADKVLNPGTLSERIRDDAPVLVVLAAGKGTRFGTEPKCIQPVRGTPLARHSMDAFQRIHAAPVICVVGHRHEDVSTALGTGPIYVLSDNPTGGTAFATYEALGVPGLIELNPVIIITMGDRIVPPGVFRRLWETHRTGEREGDLTALTAIYEPPKNRGKGRVLRGDDGRARRIFEERDILAVEDDAERGKLLAITEGNCPLYAIRAATLRRYLGELTNDNAQGQFYITDVVEAISDVGGEIRTITTSAADPEYDLLTSDVTRPVDLALLEGILGSTEGLLFPEEIEVQEAAEAIASGRPPAQVASIARQLDKLTTAASQMEPAFEPAKPVAIGISGGRLRIAFMHPDMGRFFGPAWQMPIGAGSAEGGEQIAILAQSSDDHRIHLHPLEHRYQESTDSISSDEEVMYPGDDVSDLHRYEQFGTRMSENLLLSLGYFSDEEIEERRRRGMPLPPPSLWAGSNMRRPFALIGNAIASLRTLRSGHLGAKTQQCLGRQSFGGLRIVTTGAIPEGGFSSSSAVTVATKNAINALFELGLPPDLIVHLACQAEYGTGVRAGSLDQATEQKGQTGAGTLISSNPRDNYRILGTFPVPSDRIQIIFPYSVERDRQAWRWSWGAYAGSASASGPPTTSEARKMTGKAAEIAAILTRLPLDVDYFQVIQEDLLDDGLLDLKNRKWVASILREVPLLASQDELADRVSANRDWYEHQLMQANRLDGAEARRKAEGTLKSLFAGWSDPLLRQTQSSPEVGMPLRAILAYLFGEVAKNFYLLHDSESWIESISRSQQGDRCFDIDPNRLPEREQMETELDWESRTSGPERLNLWLERHGATPFDYNQGLDDASLSAEEPPEFHRLEGSNFFRGLALIDLAEAMLKRAFGEDAVAVRVNAAGQGDYFQVHIDKQLADAGDVKRFIRLAFYRRFGITPPREFVELHPGGGAVGVRLSRFASLRQLMNRLQGWRVVE